MISSELSGSHHHPNTAILKMSIEIAASFNQSPSHRVLPSAKFYLTSALERTAIAIESKEFTKSAILQPSDRPSVSPMLQNTPPMAISVPLQNSMSILMAPKPIGGVPPDHRSNESSCLLSKQPSSSVFDLTRSG
jgi:hypothetical protein